MAPLMPTICTKRTSCRCSSSYPRRFRSVGRDNPEIEWKSPQQENLSLCLTGSNTGCPRRLNLQLGLGEANRSVWFATFDALLIAERSQRHLTFWVKRDDGMR